MLDEKQIEFFFRKFVLFYYVSNLLIILELFQHIKSIASTGTDEKGREKRGGEGAGGKNKGK